jgi:hypothetical protein
MYFPTSHRWAEGEALDACLTKRGVSRREGRSAIRNARREGALGHHRSPRDRGSRGWRGAGHPLAAQRHLA